MLMTGELRFRYDSFGISSSFSHAHLWCRRRTEVCAAWSELSILDEYGPTQRMEARDECTKVETGEKLKAVVVFVDLTV